MRSLLAAALCVVPLISGCGAGDGASGSSSPASHPSGSAPAQNSAGPPLEIRHEYPLIYQPKVDFRTADFDAWLPDTPTKKSYSFRNGNSSDVYNGAGGAYWIIVEHNLPEGATMESVASDWAHAPDRVKRVKLVEGDSYSVGGRPGYSAIFRQTFDDGVYYDAYLVVQDGSQMLLVETGYKGGGTEPEMLRTAIMNNVDLHLTSKATVPAV